MTSVRRAVVLSLVERYLLLVLALATNVALARLLTPEQVGVFSVSLAVIGVAQAFRDFGIGSYLIQARDLGEAQIRTAFGISLLLGATFFAASLVAAPWAAGYYREPRMLGTLQISSMNFLLLPFCTVSLSLLRREMQFRRLLYVAVVAAATGSLASISLALAGFGENSLAVGAVLTNLVTGLGAWLARPGRSLLRPGFSAWRSVLKFGGQSSIAGFVTSVSMDANDLVVGKLLGFHPVAMLSRAQGLMNLFHRDLMGAIRNVALPAFASAHRDGQSLEVPFAHSVALVTVFAWPFYGIVSVYALEILHLLYGPQWYEAKELVPVFCMAGVFAAVNALTPNLLVAMGRIDLLTKLELSLQPVRLVLVVAAALHYRTVFACSMAFLISAALALPVFWWAKRQCVDDNLPAIVRDLSRTLAVTAATLALPLIHATWLGWGRDVPAPLWQWILVAGAGVGCGAVAVRQCSHPLATEPVYVRISAMVGRVGSWRSQ